MQSRQEHLNNSKAIFDNGNLSDEYLKIERVLNRVECAANHYEVLGLSHAANNEQINLAYDQVAALLQPSYYRINVSLPAPTLARIDKAMQRILHAYGVLSSFAKRREYDNYLFPKLNGPAASSLVLSSSAKDSIKGTSHRSHIDKPCAQEIIQQITSTFSLEEECDIETASDDSDENRRKFDRVKLSIPAYITGHDRFSGEWHEMTYTIDVSRVGALVYLRRRVRHRALLHLALPLPMKLRCYRHSEPSYGVYAVVRRVEPPKDGLRVVAVEFVGEHPPESYIERPWATYLTQWGGHERRRLPRQNAAEVVYLEYLDEAMQRIRQEAAITENTSRKGMRVYVKSPPPEFELVKVRYPNQDIRNLAIVCNRYVAKDRLERLCLQFIEEDRQE